MKLFFLVKRLIKKLLKWRGKLAKTTPKSKAPGWFKELNKQPNHRSDGIENRLNNIENRLTSIENDVEAIKNTRKMKKELNK